MDNNKALIIKKDAIVPIEVSGGYYLRMRQITIRLLERQPDPKKTIIKIDEQKEELTFDEFMIETFMSLLKTVEDEANTDKAKYMETFIIPKDFS